MQNSWGLKYSCKNCRALAYLRDSYDDFSNESETNCFEKLDSYYYCQECKGIICQGCTSPFIEALYCPQCLQVNQPECSTNSGIHYGNRCKKCFLCPKCSSYLSFKKISFEKIVDSSCIDLVRQSIEYYYSLEMLKNLESLEDPNVKDIYFLSCSFCRYSSLEAEPICVNENKYILLVSDNLTHLIILVTVSERSKYTKIKFTKLLETYKKNLIKTNKEIKDSTRNNNNNLDDNNNNNNNSCGITSKSGLSLKSRIKMQDNYDRFQLFLVEHNNNNNNSIMELEKKIEEKYDKINHRIRFKTRISSEKINDSSCFDTNNFDSSCFDTNNFDLSSLMYSELDNISHPKINHFVPNVLNEAKKSDIPLRIPLIPILSRRCYHCKRILVKPNLEDFVKYSKDLVSPFKRKNTAISYLPTIVFQAHEKAESRPQIKFDESNMVRVSFFNNSSFPIHISLENAIEEDYSVFSIACNDVEVDCARCSGWISEDFYESDEVLNGDSGNQKLSENFGINLYEKFSIPTLEQLYKEDSDNPSVLCRNSKELAFTLSLIPRKRRTFKESKNISTSSSPVSRSDSEKIGDDSESTSSGIDLCNKYVLNLKLSVRWPNISLLADEEPSYCYLNTDIILDLNSIFSFESI